MDSVAFELCRSFLYEEEEKFKAQKYPFFLMKSVFFFVAKIEHFKD